MATQQANNLANNSPLNNLQCPTVSTYEKMTPDILRNLNVEPKEKFEKNYSKQKIGDGSEKPLNIPVEQTTETTVFEDHTKTEKYVRKRKIQRGLCCIAWIFCAPLMLLGLSRREPQDPDDDDLKDDPCCPCYFDPYYDRRQPASSSLNPSS